jgi:hypothetical protein
LGSVLLLRFICFLVTQQHLFLPALFKVSPCVEIGRQATLRWWYSQGCAGSNPVVGTQPPFLGGFLYLYSYFLGFILKKIHDLSIYVTPL